MNTMTRITCMALLAGWCIGASAAGNSLKLASSDFTDNGLLPQVFTCDSEGICPPLSWTGAPSGTAEFALTMTTLALDGKRWNWVLYHVPASANSLARGATNVGTFGLNSDLPGMVYAPPCSKGPGPKQYTFTLYALSQAPVFSVPAAQVTGPVLTSALNGIILDSAQLTVTYSRVGIPEGLRFFGNSGSSGLCGYFSNGSFAPVRINGAAANVTCVLTDITGRRIWQGMMTELHDLSRFARGTYVLRISAPDLERGFKIAVF